MRAALLFLALTLAACNAQKPIEPDPLDAALASDAQNKTAARFERLEARVNNLEKLAISAAKQRTDDQREVGNGQRTKLLDDMRTDSRLRRLEDDADIGALRH